MGYYLDLGIFKLTDEQASFVKELRCGKVQHSWRMVARRFTRRFPAFVSEQGLLALADKKDQKGRGWPISKKELAKMTDWENGNQLLGVDLCTAAMRHFGEAVEDGWN
jgi:hypothetical protein